MIFWMGAATLSAGVRCVVFIRWLWRERFLARPSATTLESVLMSRCCIARTIRRATRFMFRMRGKCQKAGRALTQPEDLALFQLDGEA